MVNVMFERPIIVITKIAPTHVNTLQIHWIILTNSAQLLSYFGDSSGYYKPPSTFSHNKSTPFKENKYDMT